MNGNFERDTTRTLDHIGKEIGSLKDAMSSVQVVMGALNASVNQVEKEAIKVESAVTSSTTILSERIRTTYWAVGIVLGLMVGVIAALTGSVIVNTGKIGELTQFAKTFDQSATRLEGAVQRLEAVTPPVNTSLGEADQPEEIALAK